MKTPKRIQPLIESGLVDEVVRPLMSGKEADVFVVRLDPTDGSHTQTQRCGDSSAQVLYGLAAARDEDDVYLVAGMEGSINLGDGEEHTADGEIDVLVAQLNPAAR